MYRFIQSDLFTFHIGKDRHSFVAHSKAVSTTSNYFKALINGCLKEAQTRLAELEDVDPDTFVRFLEYAYQGDYTSPQWTSDIDTTGENSKKGPGIVISTNQNTGIVPPGRDVAQSAAPFITSQVSVTSWRSDWPNKNAVPSAFGAIPSTRRMNNHGREQSSSREIFNKREYIHPDKEASILFSSRCAPKPNTPVTQNFVSVFLAHASLYTFADMRMVYLLKNLVLYKLHKTLVCFELYPERLGDIIELAKYAYEHGEDRSEDGLIDALRDMIANYIACERKVLSKHTVFRDLMDRGGEFAGDFWDIVSK